MENKNTSRSRTYKQLIRFFEVLRSVEEIGSGTAYDVHRYLRSNAGVNVSVRTVMRDLRVLACACLVDETTVTIDRCYRRVPGKPRRLYRVRVHIEFKDDDEQWQPPKVRWNKRRRRKVIVDE